MKIRIKHILIILILIIQASCSEWIELIPPEGLIREEFWQTKEDVEAVVMGAYESFGAMDEKLFKYGEIRADMVVGDVLQSDEERNVMESNIYPENSFCNWSQFYQVIDYCNEVIKNAPLVKEKDNTFTSYQMHGYISEATFLRALSYFYLVRLFKDVPFILKPTETDDSEFYIPKTDGEEILRYLIDDLKENRNYATTDGYQTLEEVRGRATKASYDALLADISLWLFDYEECIKYVQNIEATINLYELLPSARWFELYYPGNSLEGIFEFQFDASRGQNNDLYGLTQQYSYNYDPSEKALHYFAKEFAKELCRGEDASIKKYGENDFIIWKYVGRAPDGKTTRSGSDQRSCNWIVYRLADVLLMKAEALSQLGRYSEALDIINVIRKRADVSTLSLPDSPVAYEDAILEERALELAFEGKRWFDLLRMGRRNDYSRKSDLIEIIVENVPSTQKRILATKLTNPMGWYLPIYESEIERNKNLIQNPYYNF
jgi:starch-binding outer membrane protein, SusD/RagB family